MSLQAEVVFEHEMTKEKLREMLNIMENAEKNALPGQVLRIKLNHNTQFIFKNLYKTPVSTGMSIESDLPIH
jgi:hypothetical protein